jgi:hypothetical protein
MVSLWKLNSLLIHMFRSHLLNIWWLIVLFYGKSRFEVLHCNCHSTRLIMSLPPFQPSDAPIMSHRIAVVGSAGPRSLPLWENIRMWQSTQLQSQIPCAVLFGVASENQDQPSFENRATTRRHGRRRGREVWSLMIYVNVSKLIIFL